ncbi:MAG: alpha/beta hydrolase, partial [Mycobacteriaceae bacterium]|nr:alpha/beta hydrolase [Mycobacteriaceae bacterium]
GKPERQRTEHFGSIRAPAVFIQGTSDPFGTPAELRTATVRIPGPVHIIEVQGARHDLATRLPAVATLAADAALQLGGSS